MDNLKEFENPKCKINTIRHWLNIYVDDQPLKSTDILLQLTLAFLFASFMFVFYSFLRIFDANKCCNFFKYRTMKVFVEIKRCFSCNRSADLFDRDYVCGTLEIKNLLLFDVQFFQRTEIDQLHFTSIYI